MPPVALPNASYSISVSIRIPADPASAGRLTAAVGSQGGVVVALNVQEADAGQALAELVCHAGSQEHVDNVLQALRDLDGAHLLQFVDRTFAMHDGGKIQVAARVELKDKDDLSMAYTPGVARICQAIAAEPAAARALTIKSNTVAVVTDGSAILGLGNLGAAAAMPVMEGKAALFKRFADVDAWPVCLDTQDTEEIIRTVQLLAPVYGGINLEDIAAPRCFEIEDRLRELLDIPVFHDDQHGTAIVVLAALINALRVVDKPLESSKIVISGAGAAGTAVTKILQTAGARNVVVCDVQGVVHSGRPDMHPYLQQLAESTNPEGLTGTLKEAVRGADVFIGLSVGNVIDGDDVQSMAERAVVFAMANPTPEIDPAVARRYAAVVATGRSDEPNQINNSSAFPGVFRGLLDARATKITDEMKVAAAHGLAAVVLDSELHADYIVPSVFHPESTKAVADAVRHSAEAAAG